MLRVDGVVRGSELVAPSASSARQLCWMVYELEPGNHLVEIGGQKAWFTVTGAGSIAFAFGVIGFFAAILVGLIIVIWRRHYST